jgi:hypothetical protein
MDWSSSPTTQRFLDFSARSLRQLVLDQGGVLEFVHHDVSEPVR